MENKCKSNQSIHCTVEQCRYHGCDGDFCTLNAIHVGTHESNPTMCECTDCQSFEMK